jgi:hypothetical protein
MVGCKRPEAEKAGCQSRAGGVYDGGILVRSSNRRGGRKFQRGGCGGEGWCLGGGWW